jgi:hypothetical protein
MDTILSQCQTLRKREIEALIKSLASMAKQKGVEEEAMIVQNLAPGQIYSSLHELDVPGINYGSDFVMVRLSCFDKEDLSDWSLSDLDMADDQSDTINNLLMKDNFWNRIKPQIERKDVRLPSNQSDWDGGDWDDPTTTNKAMIEIFYHWWTEPYPATESWITDIEGNSWRICQDDVDDDDDLRITREAWESEIGEFPFFIFGRSSDASTSNV